MIQETDREEAKEPFKELLLTIARKRAIAPVIVIETIKKKEGIKFGLIREYMLEIMKSEKEDIEQEKKEFDRNYVKMTKIKEELAELKGKAKTFTAGKCTFCKQTMYLPAVYFLCNDVFHVHCYNLQVKETSKEHKCPICEKNNIPLVKKARAMEDYKVDADEFGRELGIKPKRFEFMAKYLEKGLFKNINEE